MRRFNPFQQPWMGLEKDTGSWQRPHRKAVIWEMDKAPGPLRDIERSLKVAESRKDSAYEGIV